MQGLDAHVVAADRLNMLSLFPEAIFQSQVDEVTRLQVCDETLQAAEQHQDIYLLAAANASRAYLMMEQG